MDYKLGIAPQQALKRRIINGWNSLKDTWMSCKHSQYKSKDAGLYSIKRNIF